MNTQQALSLSAIFVSVISLFITVLLWRESNRPVVSARVITHSGGNIMILYNIEIINSGSRPAKNVRLHIEHKELANATTKEPDRNRNFSKELYSIKRCFDERATVPILLNGSSVSNAFGYTSDESPFWIPGAHLEITITYQGLQGRRYKSRIPLRIDDTDAFAGTAYASASTS